MKAVLKLAFSVLVGVSGVYAQVCKCSVQISTGCTSAPRSNVLLSLSLGFVFTANGLLAKVIGSFSVY